MTVRRRLGLALGVLLVLTGTGRADPAAPSTEPILRIETGRHSAPITHLATDKAEHLLATASLDKTVRLWDMATGAAIRTLRVPIGPGPEGSLYSVALAPDDSLLLATGYTGGSWADGFAIYVLDPVRGTIKTRLAHLPELVNDIAVAPDGGHFAAAFSGRNGLAVWDAKTGKLTAQDHDYGDIATALAYDAGGRIATVSFDGMIRLYDPAGTLAAKAKLSGMKPHSVAFSPDAALIAVGYEDVAVVDVLSAADLKPAYKADMAGISAGNLASVAWIGSGPGAALAAGGTARDGAGKVLVRLWDAGGKGAHHDVAVAGDSVLDLLGLGSGLAFAASDPAWGRLDASGAVQVRRDRPTADFRDVADGRFAVSADAGLISFGTAQGGKAPFQFDLSSLELVPSPSLPAGLKPAVTQATGIAVADWRNGAKPTVNGHAVALAPEETARSAAVIPATRRALIGTDSKLRLIDDQGRELASEALPAVAWGVAVAESGRYAVAALGDGTIRWYGLDDPTKLDEKLALFVTPDGKDWLAWSPEGHFAHAEAGGADLAGYQVNKSARETPRWVAFSQLYQLYYAPDTIRHRLNPPTDAPPSAEPSGGAAQALEQKAPPGVELIEYCVEGQSGCAPITPNMTRGFVQVGKLAEAKTGPAPPPLVFSTKLPDGITKVRLRYRVTPRQGGVGDIDLFVNGRVVSNSRGFVQTAGPAGAGAQSSGNVAEMVVALDPGSNVLNLRAYDSSDAVEERSSSVEFFASRTEDEPPGGGPALKPTLYVLGVGINDYPAPNKLNFAVKDMSDVIATIKAHSSKNYAHVVSTTLIDRQATLAGLSKSLDDLAGQVGEHDTVIIYLAGHGFIDDKTPTKPYYFITQDVDAGRIGTTSASQGFLKEKLTRIKSKNVFLFLDTCHAAALAPETFDRVHNYFGQIYILAAASSEQQALDSYKDVNGPFAFAVVEGLNGKAARDGIVDDLALGTYVKRELPRLVDEIKPGYRQSASFKMAGGEIDDFPLTELKP